MTQLWSWDTSGYLLGVSRKDFSLWWLKNLVRKISFCFGFQMQVYLTGSCCSHFVALRHRWRKQVGSWLKALTLGSSWNNTRTIHLSTYHVGKKNPLFKPLLDECFVICSQSIPTDIDFMQVPDYLGIQDWLYFLFWTLILGKHHMGSEHQNCPLKPLK